jgi:hypothetical protein
MRLRTLGTATAALVVAIAISILYSSLSSTREPLHSEPEPGNLAASSGRPATDSEAQVDAGAAANVHEPTLAADLLLKAPSTTRIEAGLEHTEELWLVDRATRAPIVGAHVRFVDLDEPTKYLWFPDGGVGLGAQRIAEQGRPFTSDARGVARLPQATGQGIAVARNGELFGLWWYDADDSRPWTLELQPDQDWVVHVRDIVGRPLARVPLYLHSARRGEHVDNLLARLVTNEAGLARIEHARWLLAYQTSDRFELHAEVLLRKPITLVHEGREPPSTPSEFVLPEIGEVEIVLQSPTGGPWNPPVAPYPTRVQLADASHVEHEVLGDLPNSRYIERDRDGRWRMFTEVGMQLRARYGLDLVNGDLTALGPGPTRALEQVVIPLTVGSGHPLLRMRMVDEQTEPLANREFEIASRSATATGAGSRSNSRDYRTSDAQGRIELPIGRPHTGTRTVLTLATVEEPKLEALVILPTPVPDGVAELGDVAFAKPPPVLAGLVLDGAGTPIESADVSVEGALSEADQPAAGARGSAPRETNPYASGPRWKLHTDSRGHFELRTHERCDRLRVHAEAEGQPAGAWIEVAPGAADVRITLEGRTEARGRVLLPPFLAPGDVVVCIRRVPHPADAGRGFQQPQLQLGANRDWRIEGLETGTWKVEVTDAKAFAWEPLVPPLRFDSVGGRVVEVPDIDLRAALRQILVRVVDAEEQPIEQTTGAFCARESSTFNDIEVRNGRARILTKHAQIDAWIGALGYRMEQIHDLQDGAVLRLRRALPVRLRVRTPPALPSSRYRLDLQIDARRGSLSWVIGGLASSPLVALDASGEAVLPAAVTGTHWVNVSVRDLEAVDGNGSPRSERLRLDAPLEFEVVESAAEQVVDVDIDAVAVAKSLERLLER